MKTLFARTQFRQSKTLFQHSKIVDKIKANYTSTQAQCSNCAKLLDALSHKGVIKNRHDARF